MGRPTQHQPDGWPAYLSGRRYLYQEAGGDAPLKELWNYRPLAELRTDPELGRRLTYGIQARRRTCRGWKTVGFLADVTTDPQRVREWTDRLNRGQLSPLHLFDAVYDALP